MTINYRVYTANYKILRYFYEVIKDQPTKKSIKEWVSYNQDVYCW